MTQPVFYLLDRDAIIMIENFLKGDFSNGDAYWDKCQAVFNEIDKPENTVSAMLAIMEGKRHINDQPIARQASACDEASVLKKYFKFASTDTDAIIKLSHSLADLSLGSHEHGFKGYVDFYKSISNELSQDISPEKRIEAEDRVIFTAKMHNVPTNHPLTISSLSALHGNIIARKVLKFKTGKKSNPYGAVSDIMQYYRVANIGLILKTGYYSNYRIQFLSFDQALGELFGWFHLQKITCYPTTLYATVTEVEFIPNMIKLFPEMDDRRIEELVNKIK